MIVNPNIEFKFPYSAFIFTARLSKSTWKFKLVAVCDYLQHQLFTHCHLLHRRQRKISRRPHPLIPNEIASAELERAATRARAQARSESSSAPHTSRTHTWCTPRSTRPCSCTRAPSARSAAASPSCPARRLLERVCFGRRVEFARLAAQRMRAAPLFSPPHLCAALPLSHPCRAPPAAPPSSSPAAPLCRVRRRRTSVRVASTHSSRRRPARACECAPLLALWARRLRGAAAAAHAGRGRWRVF